MNTKTEHPFQLSVIEWIKRAKETLNERTRTDDDVVLIDAYDDLCNALELLNGRHT